MSILNIKKPEWIKEHEKLDFNVVNKPLKEVYDSLISKLSTENKKPENFYFILKCLLITSYQSYGAIRKLIAKDPKYPTQAHFLSRSLIDTLFTISALVGNPVENSKKYEKAGYRIQFEQYEREKNEYSQDIRWKDWLKNKEDYLNSYANSLGLSINEKNDPKANIEYWPIPSQLLSKKAIISLSDERRKFLDKVYDFRYREFSDWSHMGWTGMAMGVFATETEHHWQPGKFESDALIGGLLFFVMILSEVEAFCSYGENQKLRYIWTLIGSYFDEAKDYYSFWYDSILSK